MKSTSFPALIISITICMILAACIQNQKTSNTSITGNSSDTSSHYNVLANLPFSENRPANETAKTLNDELLFQRAATQ
jgi:hypothetical protein